MIYYIYAVSRPLNNKCITNSNGNKIVRGITQLKKKKERSVKRYNINIIHDTHSSPT